MNKKQIKEAEKWIEERIIRSKQDIINLEMSKKYLIEGKCHFRINITSLWENEGEKGISYDAPKGQSLKKAAEMADQMFLKKNHREDFQVHRSAWLFVDAGTDKEGYPIGEMILMEHPKNK